MVALDHLGRTTLRRQKGRTDGSRSLTWAGEMFPMSKIIMVNGSLNLFPAICSIAIHCVWFCKVDMEKFASHKMQRGLCATRSSWHVVLAQHFWLRGRIHSTFITPQYHFNQ